MKSAILFLFVFSFFTVTASAEELYFQPNFEIIENDRFANNNWFFLIGDTVTIRGTSYWYDGPADERIVIPDTAFHVTIKDHDLKTVLEGNFISDHEGKIEVSFPLTEEHRFGRYHVEAIIKKDDHREYIDLSFSVGPPTEKIVPTESSFDLWPERPLLADSYYVDLIGVVCSENMHGLRWDEPVFTFPLNGSAVETTAVYFIANFTDPDGNFHTSVSEHDKDECTDFSISFPPTNVQGEWSVHVSAWWLDGDILYETQSDVFTFDVREPIFYNDAVEEIPFGLSSYHLVILDLNKDGDEVLLRYNQNRDDLAVLNLKDGSTSQLGMELQEGTEISSARFSSGAFLYIEHDDGALWKYHPESKESEKILSDVGFYDVLDDGRIVYSVSEEWDSFSLYSIKDDGSEKKLIAQGAGLDGFDVNDDGTSLLHNPPQF